MPTSPKGNQLSKHARCLIRPLPVAKVRSDETPIPILSADVELQQQEAKESATVKSLSVPGGSLLALPLVGSEDDN